MKRLFFLLLVLCLFSSAALAQNEGDFAYFISDGKATITGYTGSAAELILPDHLTRIHTLAFYGCSAIRYCTPDSQTAQTLSAAGLSFCDKNSLIQQTP